LTNEIKFFIVEYQYFYILIMIVSQERR